MEFLFLSLYDYFHKNRPLLYGLFIGLLLLLGIGALQIRVEEDVSKFFPNDKKLEKINQIFQNSKFDGQTRRHGLTQGFCPGDQSRLTDPLRR